MIRGPDPLPSSPLSTPLSVNRLRPSLRPIRLLSRRRRNGMRFIAHNSAQTVWFSLASNFMITILNLSANPLARTQYDYVYSYFSQRCNRRNGPQHIILRSSVDDLCCLQPLRRWFVGLFQSTYRCRIEYVADRDLY